MEIKSSVYSFLENSFSIDTTYVNNDDDLKDLGIDSIEVVELLLMIEENIGRTIESDEFNLIRTVGDVINFISSEKIGD